MEQLKRTWATISLDHLEENYRAICNHIPGSTRFLGVVKADAYGHGAVMVSRALAQLGASYLAVSNLEEAIQLRKNGIELPILILGWTPASFAAELVKHNITQEIHSLDYARQLSSALAGTESTLCVHLKMDTGMTRIGFTVYEGEQVLEELVQAASLPHLRVEGAFMHFCVSDSKQPNDRAFTALQYERFCNALLYLQQHGIHIELRHCCNSGGIVQYPQYAMDMVRSGIITYGLQPSDDLAGELTLHPVMSLKTIIAQIRTFPAGTTVSYGRTYTTREEQTLAVLPIGYADGLPRGLSNRFSFLLHGQSVPVLGRVCMDMCMVDISGVPNAKEGDTVTIFGQGQPCETLANVMQTINYETVCNVSKRVPRIFLQNGTQVGIQNYLI